jgi:hypothetical protein
MILAHYNYLLRVDGKRDPVYHLIVADYVYTGMNMRLTMSSAAQYWWWVSLGLPSPDPLGHQALGSGRISN